MKSLFHFFILHAVLFFVKLHVKYYFVYILIFRIFISLCRLGNICLQVFIFALLYKKFLKFFELFFEFSYKFLKNFL